LPFTEREFFDVFGRYNAVAWPVVVASWIVTLVYATRLVTTGASSIALSVLAAFHWAWSGVVYHAMFFARINPAAFLFAALFLLEAAALVWFGVVRRDLQFGWQRGAKRTVAMLFFAASLIYPALVIASGHHAPRAPLFAVPCPTTLFTTGLLLTARRTTLAVTIVPMLWALVGGTAAIALGVLPDLLLWVAAGVLAVQIGSCRRHVLG